MKKITALLLVMLLSAVPVFAEDYSIRTARFDVQGEDGAEFYMISQDDSLVIRIDENTRVYFEDYVPLSDDDDGVTRDAREVLFGRTLAEVLDGRNLVVEYAEVLDSYPQITSALSITILFEDIVTLPITINGDASMVDDYGIVLIEDNIIGIEPMPIVEEFPTFEPVSGPVILNGEIVINGEFLQNAAVPFQDSAYNVMIPLRPVAEALGYTLTWNDYLQSIQLGVATHTWIGNTEAHRGRMAPIELSTAPILVDDQTFVPLDFIRNVLAKTAYVFEGQVVIED